MSDSQKLSSAPLEQKLDSSQQLEGTLATSVEAQREIGSASLSSQARQEHWVSTAKEWEAALDIRGGGTAVESSPAQEVGIEASVTATQRVDQQEEQINPELQLEQQADRTAVSSSQEQIDHLEVTREMIENNEIFGSQELIKRMNQLMAQLHQVLSAEQRELLQRQEITVQEGLTLQGQTRERKRRELSFYQAQLSQLQTLAKVISASLDDVLKNSADLPPNQQVSLQELQNQLRELQQILKPSEGLEQLLTQADRAGAEELLVATVSKLDQLRLDTETLNDLNAIVAGQQKQEETVSREDASGNQAVVAQSTEGRSPLSDHHLEQVRAEMSNLTQLIASTLDSPGLGDQQRASLRELQDFLYNLKGAVTSVDGLAYLVKSEGDLHALQLKDIIERRLEAEPQPGSLETEEQHHSRIVTDSLLELCTAHRLQLLSSGLVQPGADTLPDRTSTSPIYLTPTINLGQVYTNESLAISVFQIEDALSDSDNLAQSLPWLVDRLERRLSIIAGPSTSLTAFSANEFSVERQLIGASSTDPSVIQLQLRGRGARTNLARNQLELFVGKPVEALHNQPTLGSRLLALHQEQLENGSRAESVQSYLDLARDQEQLGRHATALYGVLKAMQLAPELQSTELKDKAVALLGKIYQNPFTRDCDLLFDQEQDRVNAHYELLAQYGVLELDATGEQLIINVNNLHQLPPEILNPNNRVLKDLLTQIDHQQLLDPTRREPFEIVDQDGNGHVYLPVATLSKGDRVVPVITTAQRDQLVEQIDHTVAALEQDGIVLRFEDSAVIMTDPQGVELESFNLADLSEESLSALESLAPGISDPERTTMVMLGDKVFRPPARYSDGGRVEVQPRARWEKEVQLNLETITASINEHNQLVAENSSIFSYHSYRTAMQGALVLGPEDKRLIDIKLNGFHRDVRLAVSRLEKAGISPDVLQKLRDAQGAMLEKVDKLAIAQGRSVVAVPAVGVGACVVAGASLPLGAGGLVIKGALWGSGFGAVRHGAQWIDGVQSGNSLCESMFEGAVVGMFIGPLCRAPIVRRVVPYGAPIAATPVVVSNLGQGNYATALVDGVASGLPLGQRLRAGRGGLRPVSGSSTAKPAPTTAPPPASAKPGTGAGGMTQQAAPGGGSAPAAPKSQPVTAPKAQPQVKPATTVSTATKPVAGPGSARVSVAPRSDQTTVSRNSPTPGGRSTVQAAGGDGASLGRNRPGLYDQQMKPSLDQAPSRPAPKAQGTAARPVVTGNTRVELPTAAAQQSTSRIAPRPTTTARSSTTRPAGGDGASLGTTRPGLYNQLMQPSLDQAPVRPTLAPRNSPSPANRTGRFNSSPRTEPGAGSSRLPKADSRVKPTVDTRAKVETAGKVESSSQSNQARASQPPLDRPELQRRIDILEKRLVRYDLNRQKFLGKNNFEAAAEQQAKIVKAEGLLNRYRLQLEKLPKSSQSGLKPSTKPDTGPSSEQGGGGGSVAKEQGSAPTSKHRSGKKQPSGPKPELQTGVKKDSATAVMDPPKGKSGAVKKSTGHNRIARYAEKADVKPPTKPEQTPPPSKPVPGANRIKPQYQSDKPEVKPVETKPLPRTKRPLPEVQPQSPKIDHATAPRPQPSAPGREVAPTKPAAPRPQTAQPQRTAPVRPEQKPVPAAKPKQRPQPAPPQPTVSPATPQRRGAPLPAPAAEPSRPTLPRRQITAPKPLETPAPQVRPDPRPQGAPRVQPVRPQELPFSQPRRQELPQRRPLLEPQPQLGFQTLLAEKLKLKPAPAPQLKPKPQPQPQPRPQLLATQTQPQTQRKREGGVGSDEKKKKKEEPVLKKEELKLEHPEEPAQKVGRISGKYSMIKVKGVTDTDDDPLLSTKGYYIGKQIGFSG